MRSLVTVTDAEEAAVIAEADPDIVDIKNPAEGSLGAPRPAVAAEVISVVPAHIETSIAVGDAPQLPGTVSLAVAGAATLNPDYIKVGIAGTDDGSEAAELIRAAADTVADRETQLVIAGYADYERAGVLPPMELPELAAAAGADVVMVDTAVKDGKTLLDHLSQRRVADFIAHAHERGLGAAVAGSLSVADVDTFRAHDADIFGVRGAVCQEDERTATVSENRARTLLDAF